MKHLKGYNERLRSDVYKAASDKLSRLGHTKRAEDLEDWSVKKKIDEEEERINKVIESLSPLGLFNMKIYKDLSVSLQGDFYISLTWDKDRFFEEYNESLKYLDEEGQFNHINMFFYLSIIGKDDETRLLCNDILRNGNGYLNEIAYIGINLGHLDEYKHVIEPSSYNEYHTDVNVAGTKVFFSDRMNASKFKKVLVDIFEGNIILGETDSKPGGLKGEIIDELCSEHHILYIKEYETFAKSLKTMSVNKLYRD